MDAIEAILDKDVLASCRSIPQSFPRGYLYVRQRVCGVWRTLIVLES